MQPVRDELRDGDEREPVLAARTPRAAGACAVVPSSLRISQITPAGYSAGEPREIDRGLGVADALQHAAVARAQREDVAAVAQIARHRGRIDGDADRRRAVLRADAGRHAEARRRVDAHRVRGAILVGVALGHRREAELVDALAGEREADHAAGALDHEVDQLGRHELRRADQVALVLAILVVGDDDELARGDVGDRLFDGGEWHGSQLKRRVDR